MLQHGQPKIIRLYEKKRARGEATPLDNMPEIDSDWSDVWQAWEALNSTRPVGFGPAPIPVPDIVAYLDLLNVTDLEDRIMYFKFIRSLDAHWVSYQVNHRLEKSGKQHGTTEAND